MSRSIPRCCFRSLPVTLGWALTLILVDPAAAEEVDLEHGIEGTLEESEAQGAVGRTLGPVIVSADMVVQEGDTPPGSGGQSVTGLNGPFTNGNGVVGFTGSLQAVAPPRGGSDNFVWFDDAIIWRNSDAVGSTLSGAEGTMGIGDAMQFVYSPAVDGDDSVWSQNGLLQTENTQAPGFPAGTINTFNSRPQMIPTGRAYWISGFNESGGTSSEGRILYTSSDATPTNRTVVLRSDDLVGGLPIDRPSGIGFDYQFSDDGSHHIHDLLLDTGSTTDDGIVYVDGAMVAREASPSGAGDNWDNFDQLTINNAGNYIFSGDTDGATATDEFLAYNGSIVVREGDVLGGVTLTSSASVQALSINNLGQAVHLWTLSGGSEVLFGACDASDLTSSVPLLATGDQLDLDGDGVGDETVFDFNASNVIGPGLWLAEDDRVYVEVDLAMGTDREAIVGLELGCAAPQIVVDPLVMMSTQAPDTVNMLALTIDNTGTADLNWGLTEAPASCAAPADVPWLSVAPSAGTVAPAGSDPVTVTFDSTGLTPGTYTAVLCVSSDDPVTPLVTVDVTLDVGGAPEIVVDPVALASTQEPDSLVVLPLTIDNIGSADLDWALAEAPVDCAAPGDLPWFAAGPSAGVLAPAATQPIDGTFDSTGLAPGVYTGVLCVQSNDPNAPLVSVSLTLTVELGASIVEIPTVSEVGFVLLGLLLLAMSLATLRRFAH